MDRDPIRAPELSELETFVLAVDYGSIARAAEVLHVSSAAAAKRIRQLEAIAGAKLLIRSGRGVTPTEVGLRVYPVSRDLVDRRDRVMELLGRSHAREESRIPGMRRVLRRVEAPRPEYVVQQTEALLATIFHASGEPIVLTRAKDGLICELNDASAELTGYRHEELRGRRVAELPLWRNMNLRDVLVERTSTTGRPQFGEMLLVPKAGDELKVRGRFQAIQLHGERYVLATIPEVFGHGRDSVAA
jgi:PAS domain S-box-containing protein